jgi:3-oxoacyl-[acyl-carrier protein] reductase
LTTKYAIIIGGGSGTGRQVAKRLTTLGVSVEVWGRNAVRLQDVVDSGEAAGIAVVDISDGPSVASNVKRVLAAGHRISFVVNCAGVWSDGLIQDVTDDVLSDHVGSIVKGSVLAAQAAIKLFGEQPGHFVQIAAASAKPGFIDTALNTLAKRAQDGLQEGLARELRGREIKLTTVYPDSISAPGDQAVLDGYASSYGDVAEVIVFALTAPHSVDLEEIVITARKTGRWK